MQMPIDTDRRLKRAAPLPVAHGTDPTGAVDPNAVDQLRWEAVVQRDPEHDGEFVFAVKTTGVYCRPSCASRRAKRANVAFFDTTHAARAAGFRACKRCRPDAVSAEHRRNDLIQAACRQLEDGGGAVSLDVLAQRAGLSRFHFHRVFKTVTGLTPKAYAKAVQQRRVVTSLEISSTVTAAIYDAGFNTSSRFYEQAPAALGMSPQRFRRGAPGEEIRYAVEPCALGVILVAATRRGVCAIEFGASAHELVDRLRARFSKAVLVPADAVFRDWIGRVLAFIEQPRGLLDLPLDIQGTVFQQRVWQALREIPSGQTASYAQVAQRIGSPKATRAVAQACASNVLAVAVPCHRVVRADGGLGGYRWGVERKAELLRRESAQTTATVVASKKR